MGDDSILASEPETLANQEQLFTLFVENPFVAKDNDHSYVHRELEYVSTLDINPKALKGRRTEHGCFPR
jgi:hypothetical protein